MSEYKMVKGKIRADRSMLVKSTKFLIYFCWFAVSDSPPSIALLACSAQYGVRLRLKIASPPNPQKDDRTAKT
jgi:hypothetical protein